MGDVLLPRLFKAKVERILLVALLQGHRRAILHVLKEKIDKVRRENKTMEVIISPHLSRWLANVGAVVHERRCSALQSSACT